MSASEEGSKPGLGFLMSEKRRFFEVVIIHTGQLHGKLTVKETSLVYSADVTLPTFDVTPAETNIALNLSMVSRLNTSFYYS